MKYALGTAGRQALIDFAGRNTLVALDYDGTLAPIVPDPAQAWMRDSTRNLLSRVGKRYPLIVISGRARADVLRLLRGVPALEVIGSHGVETVGTSGARIAQRVAEWRARISTALPATTGVRVEDKRLSLAIHYRHATDSEAARRQIERVASLLDGARLVGGKKVVNIVPEEAPDKGIALLAACERLGCSRAVFAGDDDTDEDVFVIRQPQRLLAIRIGQSDQSAAHYFLHSQMEIDHLLAALLESSS